jgi:hypothetical protein
MESKTPAPIASNSAKEIIQIYSMKGNIFDEDGKQDDLVRPSVKILTALTTASPSARNPQEAKTATDL